ACDFDRSCDDSCTFSFRCPPNCGLGPCFEQPMYAVRVPVGCRGVLPECARGAQPALALECRPPPSGFACPPTTTTLPPPGSWRHDLLDPQLRAYGAVVRASAGRQRITTTFGRPARRLKTRCSPTLSMDVKRGSSKHAMRHPAKAQSGQRDAKVQLPSAVRS